MIRSTSAIPPYEKQGTCTTRMHACCMLHGLIHSHSHAAVHRTDAYQVDVERTAPGTVQYSCLFYVVVEP